MHVALPHPDAQKVIKHTCFLAEYRKRLIGAVHEGRNLKYSQSLMQIL